jgi:predicted DNA-binding transcriptional regulator AlpA
MSQNQFSIPTYGFLRLPQVLEIFPISKSAWWEGCRTGRFPKPVKLGPRTTVWRAADIRAEYAEKERELQERFGLSGQGKKELQAFLRMEQIAAEARAEGSDLGEIKRRIDGKGVVIFTLDSGGTIRDTGKEIFYSAHDLKAEHAATLYAAKKWGKRIAVEKGRIMFQPERKIERAAQERESPQNRQSLSR